MANSGWQKSDRMMSFEQIGRELGLNGNHVQRIYIGAIKKLRRHHMKELKEMQAMAAMLQANRFDENIEVLPCG